MHVVIDRDYGKEMPRNADRLRAADPSAKMSAPGQSIHPNGKLLRGWQSSIKSSK